MSEMSPRACAPCREREGGGRGRGARERGDKACRGLLSEPSALQLSQSPAEHPEPQGLCCLQPSCGHLHSPLYCQLMRYAFPHHLVSAPGVQIKTRVRLFFWEKLHWPCPKRTVGLHQDRDCGFLHIYLIHVPLGSHACICFSETFSPLHNSRTKAASGGAGG